MVPKHLITKINFGGNGNHIFFVSDDIGQCVNQETGFLAEKVSTCPLRCSRVITVMIIIYNTITEQFTAEVCDYFIKPRLVI
jgi:hypothetical protein